MRPITFGSGMDKREHRRPELTEIDPPGDEFFCSRLESWKEIAFYLGRSEKTVRRWEGTEGLPVHRLHHQKRGSVYAYSGELEAWREARKTAISSEPAAPDSEVAVGAKGVPTVPARGRKAWLLGSIVAAACVTGLLVGMYRSGLRNSAMRLTTVSERSLDPRTYESYLRGRHFLSRRNAEGMKKAVQYFEDTVRTDPQYAPAYAGLAVAYNLLGTYEVLPPKESFPKAKEFANRALQLDDTLAEAYTARGMATSFWDLDWSAAGRDFQRAIALDPSYALAHHWFAEYWIGVGSAGSALAEMKRARELDPLSLAINGTLGRVYRDAGQYEEALRQCKQTVDLDPHFAMGHWCLAQVYVGKRFYEAAIAELELANRLGTTPLVLRDLAWANAAAGNTAKAREIMEALQHTAGQAYVSPYSIAAVHAALGEKDQAFRWLNRAYDERDCQITYLALDPHLDPLRSDPRFPPLLARLHLPK